MNYFINQTIHFDADNGLLSLTDNHSSTVQLSRPSSRLLTELITRCGKTITREELLKVVWEEHGLRPSGSNLSNHISFLRKIFSQLGMNEQIIVTVPKEGFRMEADIEAITLTEPEPGELITINSKESKISQLFHRKITSTAWIKKLFLALQMAITFIVILLISNHDASSSRMNATHTIDLCQLIDLSGDKNRLKEEEEEKLKLLKSLIKERQINCSPENGTLYFRITNISPGKEDGHKVVFITQCQYGSRNTLTHCENYLSETLTTP